MRIPKFIVLLSLTCFVFTVCKKSDPPRSKTNSILSFTFRTSDNPTLEGKLVTSIIRNDSILVYIPAGTDRKELIPTITHNGIVISPADKRLQDFSGPVYYTVVAEDGNTRRYSVVVLFASGEKEILSFAFHIADNPGLGSDITGVIENDTIRLEFPVGTNTASLNPAITYKGNSISPLPGQASDFSLPVTYTVTAEDGSVRKYTIMGSQNAIIYAASYDHFVYALDAATGRVKWKFETDSAIRANPVLHDNHLYVASRDGNLYNLNPETGQLNWKFVAHNPILNDPVFYNDAVIFAAFAGVAFPGSVFSLNAVSGALNWETPVSSALAPTIGGDIVYCTSFINAAIALDARTGTQLWSHPLSLTLAGICVGDGVIYSGSDNRFECLDALTGVRRWSIPAPYSNYSYPTIANGVLYANTEGNIYAMDPANGNLYWQYSDNYPSPLGPPTVSNGSVYTCSNNGVLHAIDAVAGSKKWVYGNSGDRTVFNNVVTVANGSVYAGAPDSSIVVLNEKNGAIIWKKKTGGPVWAGILVIDLNGKNYLPGASGNRQ